MIGVEVSSSVTDTQPVSISDPIPLPVDAATLEGQQDTLAHYKINDIDDVGVPAYYGFTDKDENWYILEENSTNNTYRYARGTGNYTNNWTGRAGLSYDYFYNTF